VELKHTFGYSRSVWLALTVHAMLMRHAKVLQMVPSLGPMMMIMKYVWQDVAKFSVVYIFTMLPFAGALFNLYLDVGLLCPGFHHSNPFSSFFTALSYLFEATVNMEGQFDCVWTSERGAAGMSILFLYMITAVFMLANMLIASMAYTFDAVYSAQEVEFAFQNARLMLNANKLPSPGQLLGAPYCILRVVLLGISCGRFDLPMPPDKEQDQEQVDWLKEVRDHATAELLCRGAHAAQICECVRCPQPPHSGFER
jgi:hypothetical protein